VLASAVRRSACKWEILKVGIGPSAAAAAVLSGSAPVHALADGQHGVGLDAVDTSLRDRARRAFAYRALHPVGSSGLGGLGATSESPRTPNPSAVAFVCLFVCLFVCFPQGKELWSAIEVGR
jgi:hypothetical protein